MLMKSSNVEKQGRNKQDGRHVQVGEEAPKLTRGNQQENSATGVAYCRPTRDYTKSRKWSYEMNKELYEMYIKSKPTVYGYMKRLKEIWDEKHPDKNLEPRHLVEQVRNIKKKELLSQSDIEQITTQEERQQQQQQQQCMQQQQQRQRISITRDNNKESAPRVESGDNNEETTATGRTMNNENSDPELDNGIKEVNSIEKEHIRQVFRKNFNKCIEIH